MSGALGGGSISCVIPNPVDAHHLAFSFQLEFTKLHKFVSRGQHRNKILRQNQVLVQFFHYSLEAERRVYSVANYGRIPHRHLANITARNAAEMDRDSNPKGRLCSWP